MRCFIELEFSNFCECSGNQWLRFFFSIVTGNDIAPQLKLAPLKVFCSEFMQSKSNFLKTDPQQLGIIFWNRI